MSTHWHFGMASSMSLSGHEDDCTACIVTTADKEAGDPQCIWTIQKCSQLCLAASRSIITELPPLSTVVDVSLSVVTRTTSCTSKYHVSFTNIQPSQPQPRIEVIHGNTLQHRVNSGRTSPWPSTVVTGLLKGMERSYVGRRIVVRGASKANG